MRLLLACMWAAIAICAILAVSAQAHPLPKGTSVKVGLHKICTSLGGCKDPVPRPKINCGWNNREQREEIYDPKLDALVMWRCSCPWGKYGNCLWVRVSIRPVPPDYVIPEQAHYVWDWQRRCAAIVCLKWRVSHWYPSLRYYPQRAAA